eukprot:46335-Eustigmatos_ZCMA.PRE.1
MAEEGLAVARLEEWVVVGSDMGHKEAREAFGSTSNSCSLAHVRALKDEECESRHDGLLRQPDVTNTAGADNGDGATRDDAIYLSQRIALPSFI